MSPPKDPHGRLVPPRPSIAAATLCYVRYARLALRRVMETLLYVAEVPTRAAGAVAYDVIFGPLCARKAPTWEHERAALLAKYR